MRISRDEVAHVKGDAPAPNQGLSDAGKQEGWFLARKTALTPMLAVEVEEDEPLIVVTQEGEYELPAGWVGFVAVDQAGYPYPITAEEFDQTYDKVL